MMVDFVPTVHFSDVYSAGDMNLANLVNLQAKMDEASCGYKASLVKVDRTVLGDETRIYFFMNLFSGSCEGW